MTEIAKIYQPLASILASLLIKMTKSDNALYGPIHTILEVMIPMIFLLFVELNKFNIINYIINKIL